MNMTGLLKISKNSRFLQTSDGAPFFFLADTAWELFHRLTLDEIDFYLDARMEQGFNVIQAVLISELDGVRTPNAYGLLPLIDMNPEKPNHDYFDFVEKVLKMTESKGMFLALVPGWGDKVDQVFGIGPEIFNAANGYSYGKWLGRRFCRGIRTYLRNSPCLANV